MYIPTISSCYKTFDRIIGKFVDEEVDIFNYVENFSLDALCGKLEINKFNYFIVLLFRNIHGCENEDSGR